MPDNMPGGAALLRSVSAVALLAAHWPASAQVNTNPATPSVATVDPPPACGIPGTPACQVIFVTGSRMRRPNLKSPQPITTVAGTEFFENGQVSVGDTLNELPALRSTFSQANSTRFRGTAGLNLLDLRGLGPERTLVLINGRRHGAGDPIGTGVATDVSTIAPDLIERVDIVTGGNSAVYGSDAVAGVVNFILKKNFEGLRVRGQTGASTYGDANSWFAGALAGKSFASGRGNVVVDVSYLKRDDFFASRRPWLRRTDGFVTVDTDPPGSPNGSDGVPDRRFFRDIRNPGLTNTGVVRFNSGQCGVDAFGARYNCPFQFLPDGTLIPITGTRAGLAPSGVFLGGNGENFRGGRQLQLSPRLDTLNISLLGHFDVSPAFAPFVEAMFVRSNSSGTGSNGPAGITGASTGDPRELPRLSNPYLSDQARNLIVEQLTLQNGVAPNPNARFTLRENFLGLSPLRENARRDTLRLVGGVKGSFKTDWNYEISVGYDRFHERTKILGNMNLQRFLLAADAATNTDTGEIECRSQFDPAARIGFVDQGATLDNDIAHCIPLNLFGGNFTPQQADYLLLDTTARARSSQFDLTAFVTGNLHFLTLPGGPVSFVAGAEYRANTLYYKQDPRLTQGYTFYNSIPAFDPPKSKVKEAFVELRFPIVSDRPLLELLELDAAARASNYNLGKTGTVLAYNAELQWAPMRSLRFRGAYARAVRAPNQGELYTPASQNFVPGPTDPCSARNLGSGSSTRAANCADAGRPTATFGTPPYGPNGYDFSYSDALSTVLSGNPALRAETSDSITLGGVLTPKLIPGLSISADYYSIVVNKVITMPAGQAIINACYDAASLENPFCSLFQRNQVPDTIIPNPANPNNPQIIGNGPHGEFQFQIIEGSLVQQPLNFAKLTARGIDIEVAYQRDLPRIGRLETRLNYTHVFRRTENLDPSDPKFENVLMAELGDPQDSFNWNSSLKRGPLTFGYRLRYISKMVLNQYEDLFSVQGRAPQNADYAECRFYPSRFYHDVRLGFDANGRIHLYGGVDNVTNTKPPFGLNGITAGSAIYDNRGRFFYAGAVAGF